MITLDKEQIKRLHKRLLDATGGLDGVRNHILVDGNKRIGTYVMLVLLESNHIDAEFSDEDIIRVGMELANGEMNDEMLLDVILERTQ